MLELSAKASAALSRRCLQHLLREHGGVKPANLEKEIEEAIEIGGLPGSLKEDLHAVRQIGNFSAHPMKSTSTGQLLDVEPGEAEWTLDVLEALFDYYFVAPERAAKRRGALNEKLKDAGKPQLDGQRPGAEKKQPS